MLAHSPPRLLVLDAETEIDPHAVSLLPPQKENKLEDRFSLRRIVKVGLLFARGSEPCRIDAVSFKVASGEELDVLHEINAQLQLLLQTGGTLVTFNGKHHDLPLLRNRAQRHRAFGLAAIQTWYADRALPHSDLLRDLQPNDRRRLSSLRDVCAGFGIEMRSDRRDISDASNATARKVQVDLAGTFLSFLHDRAMALGNGEILESGWMALADQVRRMGTPAHLAPFRHHPFVQHLSKRQSRNAEAEL